MQCDARISYLSLSLPSGVIFQGSPDSFLWTSPMNHWIFVVQVMPVRGVNAAVHGAVHGWWNSWRLNRRQWCGYVCCTNCRRRSRLISQGLRCRIRLRQQCIGLVFQHSWFIPCAECCTIFCSIDLIRSWRWTLLDRSLAGFICQPVVRDYGCIAAQ